MVDGVKEGRGKENWWDMWLGAGKSGKVQRSETWQVHGKWKGSCIGRLGKHADWKLEGGLAGVLEEGRK